MRHSGTEAGRAAPPSGFRPRSVPLSLWAALLPLAFLLRPYGGLIQDARIYVGRGLADLDPAGLGRDMIFAGDAQTGFSLLRVIVRTLLTVLPAGQASMLLVAAGLVAWLAAAAALMRRLAAGPGAWAAVVAVLALPADYGTFGTFGYAEAIATPRLFAEAAVLGGLAALLDGRFRLALALFLAAAALHPLMALPGLALAGLLLASRDRRWLAVPAAAAVAVLAAAALDLPVAGRLFASLDPVWSGILRGRSTNLFPSLWPADAYGRIACRAAAAVVAGTLAPPAGRAVLWGGVGVGLGGLLLSLAFGDAVQDVLVVQLQPWRALWLLAVLGNAGLALAAVGLWRAEAGGRLALAALIAAWSCEAAPALATALAAAAVGLRAAGLAGRLGALPRRAGTVAVAAALALAGWGTLAAGGALVGLLRPLGSAVWGVAPWRYVLASGFPALPVVAAAVALALAPAATSWRRPARTAAVAGLVSVCLAAAALWDSRTDEHRMIEARDGADALDRAIGPGEGAVLWIDEDGETWFLARRPAFFNAVQGAPILFSRALALEWADRARLLGGLGLVRPTDVSPWAAPDAGPREIALTAAAVAGFCADPRRPAGLVAPGAQLAAVPAGLPARLWRPPAPIRRLSADPDGLHWRVIAAFTVVSCRPAVTERGGGDPATRSGLFNHNLTFG